MSGHSHWATIKHKKGLTDAKRGKVFSKLIKIVEAAAKKDPNPETNPTLRMAVDRAKKENIPMDKVEYAIKKAQGLTKDAASEEGMLEAAGPEGTALVIEFITDNRNRTVAEIRNIIQSHGGHLAEPGSMLWNFDKKAVVETKTKLSEDQELTIIDAGAEDFNELPEGSVITGDPSKLQSILHALKALNIEVASADVQFVPKNILESSDEKKVASLQSFLEKIDDHDDVKNVYINFKFS